ncbi:MAG: tetratricopeptide repeat protein [Rhodobacteraceae bacterium]|nr:tetratricopeptide repeat protein [Paracoccaceae bacterium]
MLRAVATAAVLTIGATPGPVVADVGSGAYLAARAAAQAGDFDAAARFYARALRLDAGNPELMESLTLAQLSQGAMDRALPIAREIEAMNLRSQVAHMVVVAGLAAEGNFQEILARDPQTEGVGPLVDGLMRAWALVGAGQSEAALEAFDLASQESGLRGFALYHKAMALALAGDFEAAEAIFSDSQSGAAMMTRRGAMARAEVLSQLGRNSDAVGMLAQTFGASFDPGLARMADRLVTGETLPFTHVTSARDGMAEVFFSVGAALNNEARDAYTLIYARAAQYLRPDHIDALLLSAELLVQLGQFDLAVEAYKKVPRGSPDHHAAELGRAQALRQAAKPDAAIEVLEQLGRDYPDLPVVHSSLGDLLRQQENYDGAIGAYDTAIRLSDSGARNLWFLHYARGISHERLDNWPDAEADFRRALELNPGQPQVLNYLGYSLVEKQIKLDEALDMIQRAVAAQPESGYIVDSLGWVLYRLGRYAEAVGHMETAVSLMPVDPVVNDHLGDVYWAVGRYREAEFQWKRALSFIDPEDTDGEADPERIRAKLDRGLDQVLMEEGAPPLTVADDR